MAQSDYITGDIVMNMSGKSSTVTVNHDRMSHVHWMWRPWRSIHALHTRNWTVHKTFGEKTSGKIVMDLGMGCRREARQRK